MRLLQLQLGRVFDSNQALADADRRRECIQQRGLARTRAAGDHRRDPAAHGTIQKVGHRLGHGPELDQALQRQRLLGKLADRDRTPVDGHRRNGGVYPATIRQASVDHRLAFIDTSTHGGDDPVHDPQEVIVVAEVDRRQFQLAAPLHINLEGAVDQDVIDRVVLEQRLNRSQPDHFVVDRGPERLQFLGVERHALGAGELGDLAQDLATEFHFLQLVQLGQVQFIDQLGVQT